MNMPRKISPSERTHGEPTPGLIREQAITTDRSWAGMARTAPGMVSGWHHHGDYETLLYVLSGAVRLEFGDGGKQALEAQAGDFVLLPAGTIHRESNPSAEESQIVVVRTGSGVPTVNVEGPEGTT